MRHSHIASFAAALIAFSCSSPDITPSYRTSQPVINGWAAQHEDYPSIVALTGKVGGTAWCTGTAIAPDVIVTAAHCVSNRSPLDTYVAYGLDEPGPSTRAAAYHATHAIETHPSWGWGPGVNGEWNDVAIVLLKEPIVGIEPVQIIDENAHSTLLKIGSVVRIAGYGQTEQGVPNSKLHAGDVPVTELRDLEMVIGTDDAAGNATGACFGDSGGPAYLTTGETTLLVGVTSRDASDTGTCGRGAVYTLPGAYKGWLIDTSTKMRCLRDGTTIDGCVQQKVPREDAGSDDAPTSGSDASPEPDADVLDDGGGEDHDSPNVDDGSCSASNRPASGFFALALACAGLLLGRRIR